MIKKETALPILNLCGGISDDCSIQGKTRILQFLKSPHEKIRNKLGKLDK